MKFVIILLALVAYASGLEFQEIVAAKERSISSQIVDAIEAFKEQMPCGVPGLGIPPMAPLKLEKKEINLHNDAMDIRALVSQFRLYGINEFDVVEFKVNAILSKVTFKFRWHNVNFKTLYHLWLKTHDSNLLTELTRAGNSKFAVKDFVLWGTARYSLGVIGGGGLRLKEFKTYASIGKVKSEFEGLSEIKIINRKLNEIIEEMIMLAINDNTDNFAEISNNFVVPLVNNIIGDRSLSDLLALIGGGGGSGGAGSGDPVEKQPCIPPPEED